MQRCMGCMREFGEEYNLCPYCGYVVGTAAASKTHLPPGTVLHERYILGRVLGQGGFGITYVAWDRNINRAVAIKEYLPNAFASRLNSEKRVSCYNKEAQCQFELGLEKTRKEANAARQTRGTDYARCQGLYPVEGSKNNFWLLRTPAEESRYVCAVDCDGIITFDTNTNNTQTGIRPAMFLDPNSALFDF